MTIVVQLIQMSDIHLSYMAAHTYVHIIFRIRVFSLNNQLSIDIFNSLLLLSLSLALASKVPIGIDITRHLSNDPRFIQFIYQNSHTLKHFVYLYTIRKVYLSVFYLQVPATVTAKVTN